MSNIHGIEGVPFLPDYKHNEGGIFFVASQAFSAIEGQVFSAIFQVELPLLNTVGNPKINGYFKPNLVDLSGLHFDSKTGHIFVISDERNTIFEYEPTGGGSALKFYFLPGNKQEGITIDEKEFLYFCADRGLMTLKGHRSVGGFRASIYNAMPEAGVDALIAAMREYESQRS